MCWLGTSPAGIRTQANLGLFGLPVGVPHHSATAQHNSTQTDVGYLNVTYGSSVYTMLYSRYLPLLTIVKSGRLCKKS